MHNETYIIQPLIGGDEGVSVSVWGVHLHAYL